MNDLLTGRWIPSLPEISRETLAVLGGAILAAVVLSQLPELKQWIADRLPTASR